MRNEMNNQTPSFLGDNLSPYAGFYFNPRVWLVERPPNDKNLQGELIDLTSLWDVVYESRLRSGLGVKGLRFGLFVFDFDPVTTQIRKIKTFHDLAAVNLTRAQIMNAFSLLVCSAVSKRNKFSLDKRRVHLSDLIGFQFFDDLPKAMGFGDVETPKLLPRHIKASTSHLLQFGGHVHYDLQVELTVQGVMRYLLSREIIDEAFCELDALLADGRLDVLQMVELLAQAASSVEDHNYALGLTISFSVAERLISKMWSEFASEALNAERKKRLLDYRAYTISIQAETLSILGKISSEVFSKFTVARKARNDWIHGLNPVSVDAAIASMDMTVALLRVIESFELSIPINLRVHTVGRG